MTIIQKYTTRRHITLIQAKMSVIPQASSITRHGLTSEIQYFEYTLWN